MTRADVLAQITGDILFRSEVSGNSFRPTITCKWKGGDVVAILFEVLEEMKGPLIVQDDCVVQFGQYKVRIFAAYPEPDARLYLARRIYETEDVFVLPPHPQTYMEVAAGFNDKRDIFFDLLCNKLRIPVLLDWLERLANWIGIK